MDINPDSVAGAFNLYPADTGALHALRHKLADLDIFPDVITIALSTFSAIRKPSTLVLGRDPKPEPVRVDLLAHYRVLPFARDPSTEPVDGLFGGTDPTATRF